MNNNLKAFYCIFALTLIFAGCKKEVLDDGCERANTDFSLLFEASILAGNEDDVSYDTEIHEYTFELSQKEEICEIGYQSQRGIEDTPYTIEIYDNDAGAAVYKADHTFSAATTSYVTPATSIILNPNTSYTLRRIQTNLDSNFANIIGRISRKSDVSPLPFPFTNGVLTITGADFYQNGGGLTDAGIPFIDMVFVD